MIVQVVNSGTDLGNDQFDLAIPGGGQGNTQGYVLSSAIPNLYSINKVIDALESGGNPISGATPMAVWPTAKTVTLSPTP